MGPAEGDLKGMAKVKRGAGSGPNSLGCVMRSAIFNPVSEKGKAYRCQDITH